jgi:lysophospholipase L1-like esterase
LKFSGSASVDLRPGVVLISDPVDLDVRAMSDLAVSLYIVKSEGTPTNHTPGLHTAYISKGDTAAASSMPEPTISTSYLWLRSIDVVASANDFAIACLGDSITDGFGTSVDKDQAWPTLLAKRFGERKSGPRVAVINEGISGNQVVRDGAGVSALARLDRDVLSQPGLHWIVLLEGINDINLHGQVADPTGLTAEDLIKGDQQIIARAHTHKIKVMGATLTPEEGVWLSGPVGEATRLKLNEWIRTSGAFDAVVDFDAAIRDKEHPARMREEFNPGDHIHPNDLGNGAMANAFQLATFEK